MSDEKEYELEVRNGELCARIGELTAELEGANSNIDLLRNELSEYKKERDQWEKAAQVTSDLRTEDLERVKELEAEVGRLSVERGRLIDALVSEGWTEAKISDAIGEQEV